jgi:CelD/BcsL family acetyltransferase involved in cellulose biosynthesis
VLSLVDNIRDFQALRESWNRLADLSPSPLMRHEFFAACLAVSRPDRSPAIFVLSEHGQPSAIAPLERVRQAGASRLQPIGRDLHEPFGFLFRDRDALRNLLLAVRRTKHPLLLARIGADEAEEQVLQSIRRPGDLVIPRDGGASPYLALQGGFEGFERRLSSARRADLRRKQRRAERLGPVVARSLSPSLEDVDAALDAFFRIEASGWKSRSGSAILSSPEREGFFRTFGRSLASQGMLRMFFLSIGASNVAARMAIQHGNRLWELKIGFDENYGHCSPGMLLTYETIRYACAENLAAVEFLGRTAAWNDFWGVEERRHQTLRYYPRGQRSLLCLASDAFEMVRQRWMSAAAPLASAGAITNAANGLNQPGTPQRIVT